MSFQLIDTATGEIIREHAPATTWHTRQLRLQARQRQKTRRRFSRDVWQHLTIAGLACLLILVCLTR